MYNVEGIGALVELGWILDDSSRARVSFLVLLDAFPILKGSWHFLSWDGNMHPGEGIVALFKLGWKHVRR